ncbi:MAG TPA: M20/M25/M40 family metallo-hydrolase [Xanthobacteraceae bacterium]
MCAIISPHAGRTARIGFAARLQADLAVCCICCRFQGVGPGRDFMRAGKFGIAVCGFVIALTAHGFGQRAAEPSPGAQNTPTDDPIKVLAGRLELERYKAAIKGLTQFGDRQQGTDRNRAAVDWIEAQLRSYGCSNIQRIKYVYDQPPQPFQQAAGTAPVSAIASGEIRGGLGGSRLRGIVRLPDPNNNPDAQSDPKLRALNAQPPAPGPREEVYCTKVGTTRPNEMYIVGAHMDGRGFGEAADDDGSGTALVMELARIFSSPDVQTARSIRFALWNNEETGLNGSRAYVEQRAPLQGREDPPGSGRYPEPRWLGMIQHDMMLWDHGMLRPDGTVSPEQRPEADVNIEFQSSSKLADQAMRLAFLFRDANEKYATDYPAAVGPHMTNTDSSNFMDIVPAISLRENERGMQIGAGWNPHYHQATDRFSAYSDKDFRLGLNAAQTSLAAIAQLSGAILNK